MASWEYKVVYMDFRGRASAEGAETFIAKEERRSAFARRVMNQIGAEGWELVSVQPLWPAETSYLVFKRAGTGDFSAPATKPEATPQPETPAGEGGAPTQHLSPEGGATPPGQGPVTHL